MLRKKIPCWRDSFRLVVSAVVVVGLMMTIIVAPSASCAQRIKLEKPLSDELNLVLAAADKMHSAFFQEDGGAVQDSLKGILSAIARARRETTRASSLQSPHIIRYLDAITNHVEMIRRSNGDKRIEELKQAFHQLAGIVRTYNLEKDFHIFFCGNDKTTWIQRGWRAKNPINPKTRCGLPVF